MRRVPSLPRLPLVPDPLRRIDVPRDLESVTRFGEEVDPSYGGMTEAGVERIWKAVESLYRSGAHPAIQLCLRRDGEVLIDRSIGHSRGNGPGESGEGAEIATPATPFVIFSAAKAITATVIHLLDQQGKLHIADRVAEYIPEYGTHGKDAITIEHVLSHRAGVPNLPGAVLDLDNVGNEQLILDVLCDAKPLSRPGKLLSYHAISGGFILGEVVRRVMGEDIRAVLAEEILDPLGFRWGNYGVAPEDVGEVGLSYATGAPLVPPASTLLTRALGVSVEEVVRVSNDPRFLTAIVPAGNVVTTGNELSRFFELLRAGGELDGTRILEPRTIRRAITEQSFREFDFTLGAPLRHGNGFILGAQALSLWGPDTELAFGHLGFTNVLGWADPERAVSAALMTSGKPVLYPELARVWGITRRIGIEAPKVARSELAFDTPTAAST